MITFEYLNNSEFSAVADEIFGRYMTLRLRTPDRL